MDLGLKGKTALVAASSRGLGKAIAIALSKEEAKIVVCSRRQNAVDLAKREIEELTGGKVLAVQADVSKSDEIKHLVAEATDVYGGIDILVNNAGGPQAGYFKDMTDEQWQRGVELTLMSSVRLTRAVLPHMKKQQWGRIINVTSVSVKQPINELLLSNSLRLSVVGWAKTLANQVAKDGILINNVCPGWTRTDRVVEIIESRANSQGVTPEEVEAGITNTIPVGRLGQPEELANLVTFLASERASYITGTSIQVDGGAVQSIF